MHLEDHPGHECSIPRLSPSRTAAQADLKILQEEATPVFTDYILEELRRNIEEKYSDKEARVALNLMLQIVQTGEIEVKTLDDYANHLAEARQLIREKDAPVLAAAMLTDIDYLATRDKRDFLKKNPALQESSWMSKIKNPTEVIERLEAPDGD